MRFLTINGKLSWSFTVIVVLAIITIFALVGMIALSVLRVQDEELGPQATFEVHLEAFDSNDYGLATGYLMDGCTIGFAAGVDDPEKALNDMLESGFVFIDEFKVTRVWLEESGESAILGVDTRPGFPLTVPMERVDGEWRVGCGS